MPGTQRSQQFMISTATVMIGKTSELPQLNPDDHSIGLVKNVNVTADPTTITLTQGLRNTAAMSLRTAEGLRAAFEAYEYTPRNLAYATGLDGTKSQWTRLKDEWAVAANVSANANAITLANNVAANFLANDWIFVQTGEDDKVHLARLSANGAHANNVTTLTFATSWETPKAIPAGARVGKVQKIEVGKTIIQPEFAVKIVGLLPKDNKPFTLLFPKAKVVKGFGLSFQTDSFMNQPWEIEPYALGPDDTFYSEFGDASMVLFPH